MIHDFAVKHATVRIDVRLFEAVDEDAWRRGVHADLRVDDAITGERNENVARLGCIST